MFHLYRHFDIKGTLLYVGTRAGAARHFLEMWLLHEESKMKNSIVPQLSLVA